MTEHRDLNEIADELAWLAGKIRTASESIDDIRAMRDMLTEELKRRREAGYVERVGCDVDYRPGRHGKL